MYEVNDFNALDMNKIEAQARALRAEAVRQGTRALWQRITRSDRRPIAKPIG